MKLEQQNRDGLSHSGSLSQQWAPCVKPAQLGMGHLPWHPHVVTRRTGVACVLCDKLQGTGGNADRALRQPDVSPDRSGAIPEAMWVVGVVHTACQAASRWGRPAEAGPQDVPWALSAAGSVLWVGERVAKTSLLQAVHT